MNKEILLDKSISDKKEGLRILNTDIGIANNTLNTCLEQIASAKQVISDLDKLLSEKTQQLDDIIKDSDNRILIVTNAEQKLENSLNEYKQSIKDLSGDIENKKEELHKLIVTLSTISNDVKDKTEYFDFIIKTNTEVIDSLEKNKINLQNEVIDLQKNKSVLIEDVDKLENKILELNIEFTKTKEILDKELLELNNSIDNEKFKITKPLEFLKKREEEIDIKLNDLFILKNRLSRQHKELNPNKNLPIELQSNE